jgi:23S rRNA (uracil1939-C5)-methyltransferase
LPPREIERPLAPGTEVLIERLGHLGDGLGSGPDGPLNVPMTAPGDRAVWDGAAWQLAAPGASRQGPPCAHYGACGGCNLQHVAQGVYSTAKREWIIAALARQGLAAPVAPLVPIAQATRRRASFAVRRDKDEIYAGFQARRSHEIVRVPDCLILRPRMKAAIPAIARLAGRWLGRGEALTASLTQGDTGLDLSMTTSGTKFRRAGVMDAPAVAEAGAAGVLRVALNGEVLMSLASPRLNFSGVDVDLPPGAFVQASEEALAALVALVHRHLRGAARVADLYAGLGPFTFAIAREAAVCAYEGDGEAIASLEQAVRRARGLKPVEAHKRDLARRPLMPAELKRFDAVILDPPRIGAEAQSRVLALSNVGRVAYVSCQPASFARDARLLVEGGFRLERVTPVDQFLWSHHVELVGTFSRR